MFVDTGAIYLHRDEVDFRNYALRVVMLCSGGFGPCLKYPLITFTAHNVTVCFGFNIAMILSLTLKHPIAYVQPLLASTAS